ncbi:hypothetical protein SBBP2_3090008 [Burkholderiales bacterium]|jgi:hypothetical protein|nr:hypothetical protein SBBP2_3090008 [Burkholderiales bacterium]
MNIAKSSEQFMKGLQNIERAIIDGVQSGGRGISAKNFTWHRGKDLLPPPSVVELELLARPNTVSDSFSRDEIEESWERVNRPDTQQKIRRIIDAAHR